MWAPDNILKKKPEIKEPKVFVDYQKWRNLVYRTNYLCMQTVLITEIVMYFIFKTGNLFAHPVPVYLFRFLILSTLVNAALLLAGWVLKRVFVGNERALNAIPVLQLTMMCFLVSTVHHVFSVTFCTFSFPIFLSNMFNDRRLTYTVTGLSFTLLTAAQFIGPAYNNSYSVYLIPEWFVASIALFASFLICSILVRFQDEKNRFLETVYQSRMEAIVQLNLDQKTGLYGITAFHNRLDQLLREKTEQSSIALAVFDIDDFKQVNDRFGHAKGDEVIQRLAQIMKRICGDRYFPVRFGGEEFVILFFDGTWQEYQRAVTRQLTEFADAEYDFTDSHITLSAGIAQWEPGCTSDELFDRADKALYVSKATGKNRVTTYESITDT